MKWWPPFGKRETRATAQGYTAGITAAFQAGAGGSDVTPLATAALESACSFYSRCMTSAMVEGADHIELTPSTLALIARDMIRKGESHHLIVVRDGRVQLRPQAYVFAQGGSADPMSWVYQSTEFGPSDSVHRWVPAAEMVHVRYAVDSARPWLGIAPWQWCGTTSKALAALDAMIAAEAGSPFGSLLGVPASPQIDEDGAVRPLDGFRGDLAAARGRTLVMERSSDWSEQSPQGSAGSRFEHLRFGFPLDVIDPLRTATAQDILSACGCPPSLFISGGDGTGAREAFRRFLHSSLKPLARLMEGELRLKLDAPRLTLDLSEINASDISGKARAYSALIKAGMTPADAARNTGLVQSGS